MVQHPELHRCNRLLSALRLADFERLSPHLSLVSLELGRVLYEPGDETPYVYFPQTSMVSLTAVVETGQGIEIAIVGADGAVPAISGLGLSRAFSRAVVQGRGKASRIKTAALQQTASDTAGIRELLLRYHEAVLIQIQQTAVCNAFHDAEARLARWLLQSHDRSRTPVITLTQEFLSQLLGVRRATLNSTVRALQRSGVLRSRRGLIEILDRDGLEQTACECYRVIRDRMRLVLPESGTSTNVASRSLRKISERS